MLRSNPEWNVECGSGGLRRLCFWPSDVITRLLESGGTNCDGTRDGGNGAQDLIVKTWADLQEPQFSRSVCNMHCNSSFSFCSKAATSTESSRCDLNYDTCLTCCTTAKTKFEMSVCWHQTKWYYYTSFGFQVKITKPIFRSDRENAINREPAIFLSKSEMLRTSCFSLRLNLHFNLNLHSILLVLA